jgi:hypothetical protein
MRTATELLGVAALSLLMAGCGTTQQQRAATGGLTGLGVGAIIGGPVGAAVGVAAGAAGGAMMPEDATSIANNMLGRVHHAGAVALGMPQTATAAATGPSPPSGAAIAGSSTPPGLVKEAQAQLQNQGLYHGAIDGIVGPQTRRALRAYQRKEGLRQTARLDQATIAKMNIATAPQPNQPSTTQQGSSPAPATPEANPAPAPGRETTAPATPNTGNPPPQQ